MLRTLPDPHHLPALDPAYAETDLAARLGVHPGHPPRILLLYGSLRPVSYSRLLTEEAARLLIRFGCEVRIFDPSGLPQPDSVDAPGHAEVE
jgi:arsenical resistance protein ArsH